MEFSSHSGNLPEAAANELLQYVGSRTSDLLPDDAYPGAFALGDFAVAAADTYPYNQNGLPAPEASATNMPAVEHERQVINRHLSQLRETAPSYYDYITTVAGSQPPMKEDCVYSVQIPAHLEQLTVYNALENMFVRTNSYDEDSLAQTTGTRPLDPRIYEVNVCVNDPTEAVATREAVDAFADRYKDLPLQLNLIDVVLPTQAASVGVARKILQDVAVMRSVQRAEQTDPLLIVSADSDTLRYPETSLHYYRKRLEQAPLAPMAQAYALLAPQLLTNLPELLARQRVETMAAFLMRSDIYAPDHNSNFHGSYNMPIASGSSTAYRAADMLEAGGYPASSRMEDLMLGERLALYKGSLHDGILQVKSNAIIHVSNTLDLSPRRLLVSLLHNQPMYYNGQFTDLSQTDLGRIDLPALLEHTASETLPAIAETNMYDAFDKILRQFIKTAPEPRRETALRHMSFLLSEAGVMTYPIVDASGQDSVQREDVPKLSPPKFRR